MSTFRLGLPTESSGFLAMASYFGVGFTQTPLLVTGGVRVNTMCHTDERAHNAEDTTSRRLTF